MGNAHGAELFADQDSVAEPGTKSIISASFDDLKPPITADDFLSEYIAMLKYPVSPMLEAVLKKVEVDEKSPDEFTVKLILDGKKLDAYGHGRGDGCDAIRMFKKVTVDRSKKTLIMEDFIDDSVGAWADVAKTDELIVKVVCYVLSGPTRCEFCIDKGGSRMTGEENRDAMYFWTDPLLEMIQQDKSSKVLVTKGAPSIKETGSESNVSRALEEHCGYDKFFEKMVDVMKQAAQANPSSVPDDSAPTEFKTEVKQTVDDKERITTIGVKWAADVGSIEYTILADGVKQSVTQYHIHKSPFVVESWTIGIDGERIPTSDTSARQLQRAVNTAVEKANSWFG